MSKNEESIGALRRLAQEHEINYGRQTVADLRTPAKPHSAPASPLQGETVHFTLGMLLAGEVFSPKSALTLVAEEGSTTT